MEFKEKVTLALITALFISVCPAFAQIDVQTHGTATQSSDWNTAGTYVASKGIDGDTSTFTHTLNWDASWWQVVLDQVFTVKRIHIFNRNGWDARMQGLNLRIYDGSNQLVHESVLPNPGPGEFHPVDLPDNTQVKRIWIGLDPGETNGQGDSIVTIADLTLYEEYNPPNTDPFPAITITDPVSVNQYDDAIALYFAGFDVARRDYPSLELSYRLIHSDGSLGPGRTLDLTKPWEKPGILIRKDNTEYAGIVITAGSGANLFFRKFYPLNGTVNAPAVVPTLAENAVIELGQYVTQAPAIPLPDRTQYPTAQIGQATHSFDLDAATLQVKSDINFPQVSSGQLCALSRQTDFPTDETKRSLYIPLKSQLFDQATGNPDGVAHYLCEVPLDPAWLSGTDDLALTLDSSQIKVHRTDLVDEDDRPITGDGGGGLGQGSGTMDVDADGNIYFSNSVPTDVVRFNVHTAEWEAPPVDILTLSNTFLPTDDEILGNGGTNKNGRWQTYRMVASMNHSNPKRMLHGRTISRLIFDGTLYEWSALFTLPTDWSDPVAFTNGFKLLVGSWPAADHSFYDDLPVTNGPLRRIQYFRTWGDSVYVKPYPQSIGGPWRVDVASDNTVENFGTPTSWSGSGPFEDYDNGPRDVKPYNADNRIQYEDYGLLIMDRGDLFYCLNGTENNSLTGQIEISYDAVAYMLENSSEFQVLLDNMAGPSLAPSYMSTHLPGQAGKLLGTGEYGYYLAEFDVNETTPGEVQKEFLTLDSPDPTVDLPLKVGLGPYGYQWTKLNGDDWLYIGGYTGLTRLKYSENGVPLQRHVMDSFHLGLATVNLDAAGYGPIKRYRYMQHGLDDRMFLTGTHTAARGGTAFTTGLMSFHQSNLDTLWRLSYMSRSFVTIRLKSRIIRDLDGVPEQEFNMPSYFDAQYALTIPAEQVPANTDPKLFLWDYKSGGQMRDLMGFTQPALDGSSGIGETAYSNDRRYIISLQGNQLTTFDPQTNRFIDGKTISYGNNLQVGFWERPSAYFTRAPDDRLFLYVRSSDTSTNLLFLEIKVSPAGVLSLEPYLELHSASSSAATLDDSFGVQHTYLPDIANTDGSYDLVLGQERSTSGGGTVCRLIKDFIPPRSFDLARTVSVLSTGAVGATVTGSKPGVTPYSASCTDGENITLTATAPAGYAFQEWQDEDGNVLSTASSLQLTMSEDRVVTAVYEESTGAITGVSASDSTYSDKVRITWLPANPVDEYRIFRAAVDDINQANQIAQLGNSVTSFDDTATISGVPYFYWVRGWASGSGLGPAGASDAGQRAVDTGGNSAGSATPLSFINGTSVHNGTLEPGDSDWFQFSVSPARNVVIYTTGTLDTVGSLYHSTDPVSPINSIAEDDDRGSGANFRIEQFLQAGSYYVEVTSSGGNQSGAYQLHIELGNVSIYRPDMWTGPSRSRMKGNNRYSLTGAGQTTFIKKQRRATGFIRVQNDGDTAEQLRVRALKTNRYFRFKYFRLTGGKANVTGAVSRGTYRTTVLNPGGYTDFRINVSPRYSRGMTRRQVMRTRAYSVSQPSLQDVGKIIFRITR